MESWWWSLGAVKTEACQENPLSMDTWVQHSPAPRAAVQHDLDSSD